MNNERRLHLDRSEMKLQNTNMIFEQLDINLAEGCEKGVDKKPDEGLFSSLMTAPKPNEAISVDTTRQIERVSMLYRKQKRPESKSKTQKKLNGNP